MTTINREGSTDAPALEETPLYNRLIETAERKEEISKFGFKVKCAQCHVQQVSVFDKLYVFAFERCPDCTPAHELEAQGEAIFKIVGSE